MGGNSSSAWTLVPAADGAPAYATWAGEVVVEGGGFCGCRRVQRVHHSGI